MTGLRWARHGGYQVWFADGLLNAGRTCVAGDRLRGQLAGRKVLVVTTPTVDKHYGSRLDGFLAGAGVDAHRMTIARSEASKTPDAVLDVVRAATAFGLGRDDLMVAFGGGLCCDVVTVAAAGYRRGIGYLCLPTTLVGQIDAGIGLKGAVNLDGAKSRWGVFHPPRAVFADPGWLSTLDPAAFRMGAAELVKVAAVRDLGLFCWLEDLLPQLVRDGCGSTAPAALTALLDRAAAASLAELALNPFEEGDRARLLDFGHTVSPAIEERSRWTVPHGEAVAVDIAFSCALGVLLGVTEPQAAQRVRGLLEAVGLPLRSRWLTAQAAESALAGSAAHRGALHLVVPATLGHGTFVERVQRDLLARAL